MDTGDVAQHEQVLAASIAATTLLDVTPTLSVPQEATTEPSRTTTASLALWSAVEENLGAVQASISTIQPQALIFRHDPNARELDPEASENRGFIECEEKLRQAETDLDDLGTIERSAEGSAYVSNWRAVASNLRNQLIHIKRTELIARSRTPALVNIAHPTIMASQYSSRRYRQGPTYVACLLMVAIFHLLRNGTRADCDIILAFLQAIISIHAAENASLGSVSFLAVKLPRSMRTAIRFFRLDPFTTQYICCPRCCALSLPLPPTSYARLPRCSWKSTPNSQHCDMPLFHKHRRTKRLVVERMYEHNSVIQWLGQMLNRPGFEQAADSWPRTCVALSNDGVAEDIWAARRLRKIRFSDGHTVMTGPKETGHYIFSLAIDWFNAHGGKVGKKQWSIGAIYLVCENLPPHIRHLQENVCLVGVIPGPRKPKKQQLNHFLEKIVEELLLLRDGLFFDTTESYPNGRLVYGKLGPVIADLDACRAIAGCTSHNHNFFCSFCRLPASEISNLNPATWPEKTNDFHRDAARRWYEATSEEDRSRITRETGVFWTPLMKLEYWDPTLDLVLDVMHNQFLGIAQAHCRNVWGMDISVEGGEGTTHYISRMPSKQDMAMGWAALNMPTGVPARLHCSSKAVLQALCVQCGVLHSLPPKATKQQMNDALLRWRQSSIAKGLEDQQYVTWALAQFDRTQWWKLPRDFLLRVCETVVAEEQRFVTTMATGFALKYDFQSATPTQLAEHLKVRVADSQARSAEDFEDDYTLQTMDPDLWGSLRKPVLVRLALRYTSIFEAGYYASNKRPLPHWTVNDLAGHLKLKIPRSGVGSLSVRSNSAKRAERVVLGSSLLRKVTSDMDKTVLPDWISPAPSSIGVAAHGKLSANEWRSLITIHLPITLIALWGFHLKTSRPFAMLQHFLSLCLVISLVGRRSTSEARRKLIMETTISYLKQTRELFPDVPISPNHHLALHLPRLLRYFGPPHAWWSYPFERFNGILQQTTSSHRFVLMERTMMTHFVRAANLRALLRGVYLPDWVTTAFSHIIKMCLKTMYNGHLDMSAVLTPPHDPGLYTVFPNKSSASNIDLWFRGKDRSTKKLASEAVFLKKYLEEDISTISICSRFTCRGATYCPTSMEPNGDGSDHRNSTIQYRHQGSISAGRIVKLVYLERLEEPATTSKASTLKILVQPYQELSEKDLPKDPFRPWFELGGKLVYSAFCDHIDVVEPTDLIAHVARCPFSDETDRLEKKCTIIWPLDRS